MGERALGYALGGVLMDLAPEIVSADLHKLLLLGAATTEDDLLDFTLADIAAAAARIAGLEGPELPLPMDMLDTR